MSNEKVWDVVVIGGGPAGMMAAGRAGELGKQVLLLEKNPTLGKKLLLSGGSRCNFTNHKPTLRLLLAEYGDSAKYLFSAHSQFSTAQTLEFFSKLGVESKEENDGRIFPTTNKAETILNALKQYLKNNNVTIQTQTPVAGIKFSSKEKLFKINTQNKQTIATKACIVAVGGTAYPQTGSTGEGFIWLQKLGHKIIPAQPSLVPVKLANPWVKSLSGVVAKNIRLLVVNKKKKVLNVKGDLLFTHFGITGPMVLNASKTIGELFKVGLVTINLDLLPQTNIEELKLKLQSLLIKESNKKLKNILSQLMPSALAGVVLNLAKVDGEIFCHSVTKIMRKQLAEVIKHIPLTVSGLISAGQAIYCQGGVAANEVNFKTMESRLASGLYIIGDTLDIERQSGGYSLQLAWTTGYLAGSNC